ncbi:tRNA-uridine aminocarboxypropyltransferase 2-like [Panonychus citri]|uniref:tRNA-uridine aminocarboxypropyltransferase 2-like n=1 Tax=Panonychus citri TaxID=50023 RepID=UPI00230713C6|nr:tRNA-uridine aminocarboxypropyltransferase 2-like [Panonychus citri]
MSSEDELGEVLDELLNIPSEPQESRKLCDKCCRPEKVCLCPYLPGKPIPVSNKLIILQHPSEEKRCLRTAKILELSLPVDKFRVIKAKRFSAHKQPELAEILKDHERTFLLFPGKSSQPLETIDTRQPYNIVIIDGTWAEARCIYHNSHDLKNMKKVVLNVQKRSNYVIRTQPTEESLSTVETAAITLAHLENNQSIYDTLMKPLQALCTFQLEHGAVHHFSKEYLILNGLYNKPITRKIQKKLGNKQEIKYFIR